MSLHRKKGDTWKLPTAYTNIAGDPISLTGITILSQIRDSKGVLILELTPTVVSAAAGTYTLTATATQTIDLAIGNHTFDVQFSDASGNVDSTENALFAILPDNSRSE